MGDSLLLRNGELYLELHRGTYTSHGAIKKGNRSSEILLRDIEYAATLASISSSKYQYPKDKLDELWEFGARSLLSVEVDFADRCGPMTVLTNQFHDVLPGSGIHMIYEDAEAVSSCDPRPLTVGLTIETDLRGRCEAGSSFARGCAATPCAGIGRRCRAYE